MQGHLHAAAGKAYLLQFFANPAGGDPTGHGQGAVFVGQASVTTDDKGNASFIADLPATVDPLVAISATATDDAGDTSEFSTVQVAGEVSLQFGSVAYAAALGDGQATITVTRTGWPFGTVAVDYTAQAGTAVDGVDFRAVHGTLVFGPDEETKSFTVPILANNTIQAAKTVMLSLGNPQHAPQIGTPATAVLTIANHNHYAVRLDTATATAVDGVGKLTLTVTRDGDQGLDASVDFATGGGTAVANVDYTPLSGTIHFAAGELSRTLTLPILRDTQFTGDRTFDLVLSNAVNLRLDSPARATVTIRDADQPGRLQFASPTMSVSETAGRVTVTVVRTDGLSGTISVAYATGTGSAAPNVDYVPTSGTLIFAPGETSKSFPLTILNSHRHTGSCSVPIVLTGLPGQPAPGTRSNMPLTIRFDEPDRTPPVVTDVTPTFDARGVSRVSIGFSKLLDPARAQQLFNYDNAFLTPGRDGIFGNADDLPVRIVSASYDPATNRVTLLPVTPLPLNAPFQLSIDRVIAPRVGQGVADLSGNLLDGDGDGLPGGRYLATFGLGTRLAYRDRDGDAVSLQLDGGGLMWLQQGRDGEARSLRLLGTVANRSSLSGTVVRQGRGTGTTTIPSLVGTSGVKVRLASPAFTIGATVKTASIAGRTVGR